MKSSVQLTFSFRYLSVVAPVLSSGCQPTEKKKTKKLLKLLTLFNFSVLVLTYVIYMAWLTLATRNTKKGECGWHLE